MTSIDLLAVAYAKEAQLISALRSFQAGLIDPNGKGSETESMVESELLNPHLPPDFRCGKGNVIDSADATRHSHAVDRVIFDARVGGPLLAGKTHSVFPVEIVVAAIEITMSLDATKLRNDITRLAPIREMRDRHYYVPVPGSATKMRREQQRSVAPRSMIIGLPSDSGWDPDRIAEIFSKTQHEIQSTVHSLYVIGIGFFATDLVKPKGIPPSIKYWPENDRLFRFSSSFRMSLDRWPRIESGVTADIQRYLPGRWKIFDPAEISK